MKALAVLSCLLLVVSNVSARGQLVKCKTTKGALVIEMHPDWSPLGAARFLALVDDGFFEDNLFYRALDGFLVQFGVAAEPEVQAKWENQRMKDEPKPFHKGSWRKGMLSFAGNGRDSRSCHMPVMILYCTHRTTQP